MIPSRSKRLPVSVMLSSTIQNSSNLPFDLVDALNQAFFLHMLATDPARVLPPGKSILSMLSRPRMGTLKDEDKDKDSLGSLQRKVETMVHKAFWDEVRVVLYRPTLLTSPCRHVHRPKRLSLTHFSLPKFPVSNSSMMTSTSL